MKIIRTLSACFVVFLCTYSAQAAEYYIDKDDNGVFIQTENHRSWYIDVDDLKRFKVGDRGTYSIASDKSGTYLTIDKGGKYYIDVEEQVRVDRAFSESSRRYEREVELDKIRQELLREQPTRQGESDESEGR